MDWVYQAALVGFWADFFSVNVGVAGLESSFSGVQLRAGTALAGCASRRAARRRPGAAHAAYLVHSRDHVRRQG